VSWRRQTERRQKILDKVERILRRRKALNIRDIIRLLPKEGGALTTRQLAQWMSRSGKFVRRGERKKSRWSLKEVKA